MEIRLPAGSRHRSRAISHNADVDGRISVGQLSARSRGVLSLHHARAPPPISSIRRRYHQADQCLPRRDTRVCACVYTCVRVCIRARSPAHTHTCGHLTTVAVCRQLISVAGRRRSHRGGQVNKRAVRRALAGGVPQRRMTRSATSPSQHQVQRRKIVSGPRRRLCASRPPKYLLLTAACHRLVT